MKSPLIVVLKTKDLELVAEHQVLLDQFPDMIEDGDKQYFRIGITDKRAFYREGISYRIGQ